MNSSASQARSQARPTGVFDTLQTGFSLINRNLWLLILPICLELIVWLGPQLVIGPLLDRLLLDARTLPGLESGLSRTVEEARRSSEQLVGEREALARFNVLTVLTFPMRLLAPTLGFDLPAAAAGPTMVLPSLGVATLCTLGALAVGLGVAALYFDALADAVRGDRPRLWPLRARFRGALAHLGGVVLILFVGIVGIVLPLEMLLTFFARSSPTAASIVGPLILGVLIWLLVYLFFTVPAVVVSGVGPVEGARQSARVVRRNLWSSTGLVVLAIIISAGMAVVWSEMANRFSTQPGLAPFIRWAGIAITISGHSYITGGLIAACMTYYKERHEAINPPPSLAHTASGT